MVRRGEIRPLRTGDTHAVCVCGECPNEVRLVRPLNICSAIRKMGWIYTRESGWVCGKCAKLPRLKHDEPAREVVK